MNIRPAGYPDFGEINKFMKMHTIILAKRGLQQVGKRLYGAKIAVMGLAYKKNINDPRESPAIENAEEMTGLNVNFTTLRIDIH